MYRTDRTNPRRTTMFGREKFAEARFAEARSGIGPEDQSTIRAEGPRGHHREERHRGRGMFEGFLGHHGRGHGGFGGGDRERLFDNGELRLVILQFVAEKPSY